MPVDHSYDPPIVVVRMIGDYTTNDLKAAVRAALADPGAPSAPVLMFDLRQSTALDTRTTAQVRDMALFLAGLRHQFNGRLAMVTGSEVGYGLMRIGSVVAETGGIEPAVFRDFNAAREWLLAVDAKDGY